MLEALSITNTNHFKIQSIPVRSFNPSILLMQCEKTEECVFKG